MVDVGGTLWLGPTVLPVAAALLWSHVAAHWVIAWFLSGIFVALFRLGVVQRYRRQVLGKGNYGVNRYLSRVSWTWGLVPLHWGCLSILVQGGVPVGVEFILMSILVGVGTTAVFSFAADLRVLRWYMAALLTPIILGNLAAWALGLNPDRSGFEFISISMCASLYGVSCIKAGDRMHRFQRDTLGLQFDNEGLIRSLDQQTRQAQDAMMSRSRLLAGAAHDLRQPVHALTLYADWLRDDPLMIEDITPKIIESTTAINRLFDGLFDLAQLDQQQGTHAFEAVELAPLLKSLYAQYGAKATIKGLTLRCRVAPGCAYTDATSLRRILGNLIDNAIKYTDRGGVLLNCRIRHGQWHIEVWDTGVGIAQDDQATVFAEFFRVKSHEGTQDSFGLGLSIVQRLARRLGVEVELISELGRGSRFAVQLPISEPDAPRRVQSFHS